MNKLKEARKAAGLTQVELSRKTGLSQQDISSIERGDREPTASTLRKLADALGCKIDYIVE